VDGTISVGRDETEWRFTPRQPWKNAPYRVEVQKTLEDLAGNRIGRAFDVDTFAPITQEITGEVLVLPFRPGIP